MTRLIWVTASVLALLATGANAQSVSRTVSGATSTVTNGVSSATSGGSSSNPYAVLADPISSPSAGGELPGALGMKVGNKTIQLRGAVGVESNNTGFKAGAGIPF